MENQINNMRSVEMAFRDAYDHVMSNILGTKEKEEINLFLADVCAQLSIHMAFTTTGLPEMIQKVFRSLTVREFVFKLSMSFFARLGYSVDDRNQLVEILTTAISVLPENGAETIAIPNLVKDNLPSYSDIRDLLAANNWLITVVMIGLYLRIELPKKR